MKRPFFTRLPPKTADERLRIAAIGDPHQTKALCRRLVLLPVYRDLSRRVQPDAVLIPGDCTDNGNEENWRAFRRLTERLIGGRRLLIAMGNHDTWESYKTPHDYAPARERFLRHTNVLTGSEHTEVWFSCEIGGYPFLTLGPESTDTDGFLSDRQLAWFETALAEAAAEHPGKPVFVLCHFPLNGTHGAGGRHGGGFVDDAVSRRLQAALDRHENVFYISGHLHFPLKGFRGLPPRSVERVGEHIVSVNLPCCEYGSVFMGGTELPGKGVLIRVYADRVEIGGRDHLFGRALKQTAVTAPLTVPRAPSP